MNKRPPNGYMLFCMEKRKEILEIEKGHSNISVMKRLGEIWMGLSENEKEPFQQRAKDLQTDFNKENPNYHYKKRKQKNFSTTSNLSLSPTSIGMNNSLIDNILQIGAIYTIKQISSVISALPYLPDPVLSISILQEPQIQILLQFELTDPLSTTLHHISIAHQHLINSNLFNQSFQILQEQNLPLVTHLCSSISNSPKLINILNQLSLQIKKTLDLLIKNVSKFDNNKNDQIKNYLPLLNRPNEKSIPVMPPFFGPTI